MTQQPLIPSPRRGLSADALVDTLRRRFVSVADSRRQAACDYSMADTLMSAYAMFSTKAPSMLAFEDRLRELRIEKIFQIKKVPSDTQMRTILDGIDIEPLNEAFADLFWELQRSRELKQWLFDGQYYLIAIDGSGNFCSDKICCEHCMVRHINTKEQYYHQVVAAVLVHRTTRQVIPMAVEPIVRSDGESKNDCERNATKRVLKRLRKQHPKLNMLVVEDAKIHFLLGAKPGDHKYLFEQAIEAMGQGSCRTESIEVANFRVKTRMETQYVENLALNKSNKDVRVNFLQHYEFEGDDENDLNTKSLSISESSTKPLASGE